jgi:hypothetical protein
MKSNLIILIKECEYLFYLIWGANVAQNVYHLKLKMLQFSARTHTLLFKKQNVLPKFVCLILLFNVILLRENRTRGD